MSLRSKIRTVVEDNSTKKGKIFDYTIQLLILLSLVGFSIETLPNNSDELIEFLYVFEIFCITVFSFEYFLRIIFFLLYKNKIEEWITDIKFGAKFYFNT